MTFTASNRTDRMIDEALDLFNAGFTSKAGQKRALDNLNRAYEEVRNAWHKAFVAKAPYQDHDGEITPAMWEERTFYFNQRDLPFDLHQVRDRHAATLEADLPGSSALVARLVELRATIKAAEITPPAKDETKVRAARVVECIKALMDRRQAQFLEAIDLSEVLEDGVIIHGLTANSHYVTNDHGTTFLRTFFYLRGKLTPLNSILAGAEEAARRAKAA